jgi:hypothetical protein
VLNTKELFMTTTTISPSPADTLHNDDRIWYQPHRKAKRTKVNFPPDEDIELWLKHNAPVTFQQLADIRYSLYHHCSRADFTITNVSDDEFDLTGRHSTLRVISNDARKYLLWKLRLLGKERSWINALPRTRKPRSR